MIMIPIFFSVFDMFFSFTVAGPHVHPVNFRVPLHLQGLREVFVGIIQMVDNHFLVFDFCWTPRTKKDGKTQKKKGGKYSFPKNG